MQFGVMFGDIYHGTLLLIVGLIMVLADHRLKLGPIRWVVLMMGFWACFMGFIYNDFTGLSLDLFGTCYPFENGKFNPPQRETLANGGQGRVSCI